MKKKCIGCPLLTKPVCRMKSEPNKCGQRGYEIEPEPVSERELAQISEPETETEPETEIEP